MTEAPDLVDVRLLNLPLDLRERSMRHGADLMREMTLILGGRESGTTSRAVPQRLLDLAQELETSYGPYVASTTAEIDDATDRGVITLPEVVYTLPPSAAQFMEHIADVLAEVEDYCRSGKHLLMLSAPPEVLAYREWALNEVRRQIAGEAPIPWPDFAAAAGVPGTSPNRS
jgi:hypothetical protein